MKAARLLQNSEIMLVVTFVLPANGAPQMSCVAPIPVEDPVDEPERGRERPSFTRHSTKEALRELEYRQLVCKDFVKCCGNAGGCLP